jgi:hypothetical protein
VQDNGSLLSMTLKGYHIFRKILIAYLKNDAFKFLPLTSELNYAILDSQAGLASPAIL